MSFINPISPIQSLGTVSVPIGETYGTTFSNSIVGGFMQVNYLSDLNYTIPSGQTGVIEYSGNTIPINFIKGTGSAFSRDVLILNSDNLSSGRKKIGMLVYVYEEDQVYQFHISGYTSLWNAATASTGTVTISDFGTTINSSSPEGQAFINAWSASTIEDVDGYTSETAVWRKFNSGTSGGSSGFTSVRINNVSQFTSGTNSYINFSGNNVSISYVNPNTLVFSAETSGGGGSTGNYLPLSGGTVTGATIFTAGLTANTISATTYYNLPFSGSIVGNGTTNYVPLWTGSTGLGDSQIFDNGTNVGIGTTSPSAKLDINASTGGTIGVRISGNSSSDMLRITQTGSGNAILVEDSSNPDSTPFVVTSGGTIGVGITTPDSLLHVHNGSAGSVSPIGGTTMTIENNSTNYLSLLSSDSNLSGIVFGSPSDSFGSFIRWGHTSGKLEIGTGNANDYIEFYVENSSSKAYLSSTGFGVNKLPSAALDISGNSIIRGTLTATTVSATTYQNLPQSVSGTGTQDYVTKWDSSTSGITNSEIYSTSGLIGLFTSSAFYGGEIVSMSTSNKGITIDGLYLREDGNGSIAMAVGFDYSTWTSGGNEIAIGNGNPLSSSAGQYNIAIGNRSLMSNTVGNNNVSIGGSHTLYSNITGSSNVAIGYNSLYNNTIGNYNVTIGEGTGFVNLGSSNVYLGYAAGYNNDGNNNIFIGYSAGYGDTSSSNKLNIGDTIIGDLSAKSISVPTISATTYDNLPGSSSSNCYTTFYVTNISGCSPVNILSPLNATGGLNVTGTTNFINTVDFSGGLTATTISRNNLPKLTCEWINTRK